MSDARRAAWAWRRYVTAARTATDRAVDVRYEQLVTDPEGATAQLAHVLGVDAEQLSAAFSAAHANSVGRWKRDLTAEQLADVEAEAGPLLAELGYA